MLCSTVPHELSELLRRKLRSITREWAKTDHRASMVCFAVVADMVITLGHLEWAFIMMNIFPMKGPAKSTLSHFHGASGHTQGCKGATAGETFMA